VDVVSELPRNDVGKILKREVRKRYWPEKFPLCANHPNSNLDGHQNEQQLKETHQVL
jgi:hypothetical protein